MVTKTLSIMQVLYLKYSFLFVFDNTIRHSVYSKDTLQVKDIIKRPGEKQPILKDS